MHPLLEWCQCVERFAVLPRRINQSVNVRIPCDDVAYQFGRLLGCRLWVLHQSDGDVCHVGLVTILLNKPFNSMASGVVWVAGTASSSI